jgi:hypothetical protein
MLWLECKYLQNNKPLTSINGIDASRRKQYRNSFGQHRNKGKMISLPITETLAGTGGIATTLL